MRLTIMKNEPTHSAPFINEQLKGFYSIKIRSNLLQSQPKMKRKAIRTWNGWLLKNDIPHRHRLTAACLLHQKMTRHPREKGRELTLEVQFRGIPPYSSQTPNLSHHKTVDVVAAIVFPKKKY